MITLEELKKIPVKQPEKDLVADYISYVEDTIKMDYTEGKEQSKIVCQNDLYEGHALKRYLKDCGYKVELHKKYNDYYFRYEPDYLIVKFS